MSFSPFSNPSGDLTAASKIASDIIAQGDAAPPAYADRLAGHRTASEIAGITPVEPPTVVQDDAAMNSYVNAARQEYKREVDARR